MIYLENLFKLFLIFYTSILIPIYWNYYGPQNFLWLSDIGLFLTFVGIFINSKLLISIAAVGVLFLELIWNFDFFVNLIFSVNIIGLSDYMFDKNYPVWLRGISLFHIFMPIFWILYFLKYGYDQHAIYYFICLYWIVLFVIYNFTDPKENINWVFAYKKYSLNPTLKLMWAIFLFIGFPLLIFLPTHYIFIKLFN